MNILVSDPLLRTLGGGLVARVDMGPSVIKSPITLAEASSLKGHSCDISIVCGGAVAG